MSVEVVRMEEIKKEEYQLVIRLTPLMLDYIRKGVKNVYVMKDAPDIIVEVRVKEDMPPITEKPNE